MTTIKYDTVVTRSVAKQIAESLRSSILEGLLRVDERLPTEAELAERFAVSRPTVREALKRLAAQNLIRSQRGPSGGTFVTHPSQQQARESLAETTTLLVSMGEFDLEDIAEARLNLELLCCKYAVERRTDEQLEVMRREVELQQSDIREDEFCASDVRFHRALADAADNSVVGFIMTTVVEALQPLANMIIVQIRDKARIIEQHWRLYLAIRDQDAVAAAEAVERKMSYLVVQYRKARVTKKDG